MQQLLVTAAAVASARRGVAVLAGRGDDAFASPTLPDAVF